HLLEVGEAVPALLEGLVHPRVGEEVLGEDVGDGVDAVLPAKAVVEGLDRGGIDRGGPGVGRDLPAGRLDRGRGLLRAAREDERRNGGESNEQARAGEGEVHGGAGSEASQWGSAMGEKAEMPRDPGGKST